MTFSPRFLPVAFTVASVLVLLSPFNSFAADPPTARATAIAESPNFSAFVDDYFDALYHFSPSEGTEVGLHQYDREFEDFSAAAMKRRVRELKDEEIRLAALEKTALSRDELIDATLIENSIKDELLGSEQIESWRHDPLLYVDVPGGALDGLIKRTYAPPAVRLAALTERLNRIPQLLASMRRNVVNPPREFTELAIGNAEGLVEFLRDSIVPWARDAAGADTQALHAFELANARATVELTKSIYWMKHDLLKRSHGRFALGSELFEAKLHYEEMVDIPLDRLLVIAQNALATDHSAFVDLARQIDPSKTPERVMLDLTADHPTPETLVPSVADALARARQFLLDHHIVTLPSDRMPTVTETPPFERAGLFASIDTPGPYETGATEAFYYVTPPETNWDANHVEEHLRGFSRMVMEVVNTHEAFPGHYVQFMYSPDFPTKTRKLIGAGTNSEGWAHYAEQMMVEEGFGNHDPRIELAQREEALLRDCRFVVAIKLHTQNMSVKDAARCFTQQAFQTPANARAEAMRGTFNPTYLYYTLGKLEIYKLRQDYARAQGDAYSLQKFHDAFVSQGTFPIPLVRQILLPGDHSPAL